MIKLFITHIIVLCLFVTSCVPSTGGRSKVSKDKDQSNVLDDVGTGGGNTGGNDVISGDNGSGDDDEDEDLSVRVDLRQIVDPADGTYKTKVSIPKNFNGDLHVSGLNITSLSNRFVFVRFNFGRELEAVTLPATVNRAPGLTPQTDIEVLSIDMKDRPFENIRLIYDLFDYKDYRDSSGDETSGEVVSDPLDSNLFCRGLKLEHDSTFNGSVNNPSCDGNPADERCLYAYAKIKDAGLFDSNGISLFPSEPQIDLTGNGYSTETQANMLKKCLPDNADVTNFNTALNTNEATLTHGATTVNLDGANYTYFGPFRPVGESSWEITGSALFTDVDSSVPGTGLFKSSFNGAASGGFESFLFPRSGKLRLKSNVSHLSSNALFDIRSLNTLFSAGETNSMDGCNIRVSNIDSFTGEGIHSCNVTATIQILTKEPGSNSFVEVDSTINVKLQLTRASEEDFSGREVLVSALRTCSNSQACGADECCFNNRCWSRSIVSQCADEQEVNGLNDTGEACQSDFECASLCCNESKGSCEVHQNQENNVSLCGKGPGQTCLTKEFCREENIQECFIVKTGFDSQGNQQCAKRCFSVPTFGDCINGFCRPPQPRPEPEFDPENPDCSEAIDPPTFN